MRLSLGLVLLACSAQAGWFSRGGTEKPDTKKAAPQAPAAPDAAEKDKGAAAAARRRAGSADRDHTCAAGLVFDVYANGASADPVRVEMSGGQCETVAAFEAAVSQSGLRTPGGLSCQRRRRATSAALLRAVQKQRRKRASSPDLVPRAYGVRRDMRFVFATEEVGFKGYLPHLQITLTTLAEEPRLFALDRPHRRRRVAID